MGARSRAGKSTKAAAAKTAKEAKTPPTAALAKEQSLWEKVSRKDIELSTEEALRAVHWIRQLVGFTVGIVFGFIPLLGAPAILGFFTISTVAPPAIMSISNELDTEEIAKTSPIQTEGFMPATALFLLTWIVSYTVFLPPSS